MIIIELIGGLANQMFQYAFAKSLCEKHGYELKIDKTAFNTYKWHEYTLKNLNITENYATKEEIDLLKSQNYFVEEKTTYQESITNLPDNTYISGYFQSEKYFSNIKNIIQKEFTLKDIINEQNKEILEKIKNSNSIAIHIRRGDYVKFPDFYKKFGNICTPEYYKKAIGEISQKVENPYFYIFSDDVEWVKNNFRINFPFQIMDFNQNKGWLDLNLMLNCKHCITANSTFSWWASWLNQNPNKIILTPNKWFHDDTIDISDMIPTSWLQIQQESKIG